MAQQIQFVQLAQSEYDGLSSKSPGNIYFTSDTHRIYKGSELYAATHFDELQFSSIEASDITVNGNAVALSGHTHAMSEIGASTAAQTAITAITNASTISQMKSALTAFLQNFVA